MNFPIAGDRVFINQHSLVTHFYKTGIGKHLNLFPMEGLCFVRTENKDKYFSVFVSVKGKGSSLIDHFSTQKDADNAVRLIARSLQSAGSGAILPQRFSRAQKFVLWCGGLLFAMMIAGGLMQSPSGLQPSLASAPAASPALPATMTGGGGVPPGTIHIDPAVMSQYEAILKGSVDAARAQAKASNPLAGIVAGAPPMITPNTVPSAANAPAAAVPQVQTEEVKPSPITTLKVTVKELEKLSGIRIGKKPLFWLFTDPTCPSCGELHDLLAEADVSYTLLPVAIRGEDAAVRASRVMCSPNPQEAWTKESKGEQVSFADPGKARVKQCAGEVIDNMMMFKKLGLTAVPTIVYAKEGKVYSVIPGSTKDLEPFVKK